jgi:biotin carboxyl carrier protein
MIMRIATGLVATICLAAMPLTTAPAAAGTDARNGVCETGEFCLYNNADHEGSLVDLRRSQRDYGTGAGCVAFVGAGAGRGECVKNNAASVWNRTGQPVYVFFNSDFGGVYDRIRTGARVNLAATVRKDNASQIVGDAALTFPLRTTQAHIASRSPLTWCRRTTTNCHHDYNAADIFAATGTPVVSPVAGIVKTVNVRSSGVGSTVTVKDAFGRLWYLAHLHHSPGPVVSVGQRVSPGDRIGTVGTRNHALGTQSHLHLDMRVGVDSRVSCSGAACAGLGFVNNQPLLVGALGRLPAN